MTNDDSLFASYFWWRDFYTITHYNIYNKSKKAITRLQAKYWFWAKMLHLMAQIFQTKILFFQANDLELCKFFIITEST